MVVKTFVDTAKKTIRDSTVNHKNCQNKNNYSITVETVIKEEKICPLNPNCIAMFLNIE